MAIWISSNFDIGRSLNSHDSFPRWKFKNRAPISCSPGPILWPPTISFELHAEMAEEIDLEMCSYGQLSEVQMLRDLDLESGQGHVNIHSMCRTTCMLNHMTVASRTTEIRPFEFREISTFGDVWTLVIAFVEGNSKIGLWQAVDQVPYYYNRQFWAAHESGGGDKPGNVQSWATVGSSNAPWPLPWIGSRSCQHTQYV